MTHEPDWLIALRRYLAITAVANLVWETVQLPLYTVWRDGTVHDKVVAVIHCSAGDVLIALGVWALAIITVGSSGWPKIGFIRVATIAVLAGLAYTGFSEWQNAIVRRNWTYSPWMPLIPGLRLGLSPILQWVLIPTFTLWVVRRGSG